MKLFRLRINFVGRCNHGYSTLSGNISALNFSLFPKGSEEDSWMNSRTWERYRSTRLLSALSLFLSLGRAHLYACSILSRSKQALTKRRVLACSVERRVSFRAGVRRSSAPRERFLFKLLVVQLCEGKKKPPFSEVRTAFSDWCFGAEFPVEKWLKSGSWLVDPTQDISGRRLC